jgi:hypothetical protein
MHTFKDMTYCTCSVRSIFCPSNNTANAKDFCVSAVKFYRYTLPSPLIYFRQTSPDSTNPGLYPFVRFPSDTNFRLVIQIIKPSLTGISDFGGIIKIYIYIIASKELICCIVVRATHSTPLHYSVVCCGLCCVCQDYVVLVGN